MNWRKKVSWRRHYATFIYSILNGVLLLLPIRNWVTFKVDTSKAFPIIPFQDSGYYLGQIEGFRSGIRQFGNPFYFEHVSDGFGYGSSALFAFWGTIGRTIRLDILQTYVIMTFFTGILTYISFWLFMKKILGNKRYSNSISFLVLILVCGTDLGRPSPTQLGLWIVFILLRLQFDILNKSKTSLIYLILYIIGIALLTFSNPFYALFICVSHILTILVKPRFVNLKHIFHKTIFIPIALSPFAFKYLQTHKFEKEQKERFGLINTHLPGAIKLSFLLGIFIFLIYFFTKEKDNIYRWILSLLLSNFITLNSQIFTGIHYEMESHLSLLTRIILMTSSIFLLTNSCRKFLTTVILVGTIISTNNLVSYSLIFHNQSKDNLDSAILYLQSVSNHLSSGDVLLYRGSSIPIEVQEMTAILTHTYLYFTPAGNLSRGSDTEMLKRLACSYYGTTKSLQDGIQQVYFHKFLNKELMYTKWEKIFEFIGLNLYDSKIRQNSIKKAKTFVLRYQSSQCSNNVFEYRLNFMVDSNFEFHKV